ncbi:MAG: GNAT family N-acetyltransferase [Agarilytica sp.]
MNSIEIKRVSWHEHSNTLSDIRTRIFMQEQNVSEALEFDGLDALETTQHYLIFKDEKAIGAARKIESGQIGRICIEKHERRQGYATALTRHITQAILNTPNHTTVWLHAQCDAIPLYSALGFKTKGEAFEEAGIPHQGMEFDASSSENLEKIYQHSVIRLQNAAEFSHHATQMATAASREVTIFSSALSDTVFNKALAEALSRLARKHKQTRIRILVQNSKELIGSHHPFILLAQRLPSSINIHHLKDAPTSYQTGFIVADRSQLVFFNDEANLEGFACYRARPESEKQIELFEQLWQFHSVEDPELRRLSL